MPREPENIEYMLGVMSLEELRWIRNNPKKIVEEIERRRGKRWGKVVSLKQFRSRLDDSRLLERKGPTKEISTKEGA